METYMKKIVPLGSKILCVRQRIGEKLGSGLLVAAQDTADRPTDIAKVTYVPEHSFTDQKLIDNAESIINALVDKANNGSAEALEGLLKFNWFLKVKSIKPGDTIFISKYVGTDFHDNQGGGMQTIINTEDIIALIRETNG